MSDLFNQDEVFLTATQIAERKKEYDAWGMQIEELEKKRRERREWFHTVGKLIGPERAQKLIGDIEPEVSLRFTTPSVRRSPTDNTTWTSFIEGYVQSVRRPVDYAELKDAVTKSVLGPKLAKSEKSFYGAIGKLLEKRAIVKEEGWVFSPDAFEEYKRKVAEGEVEELPFSSSAQNSRGSRMGDEILRFVSSRPEGAMGKDIISHMLTFDEFRGPVERNNTSVYNVLSRLVKRDELRKEGLTYYPPSGGNENSGSDEETAA